MIEREFGVPLAGKILPPEQWSQTALKRLPPPGPTDWSAIFGRDAPWILDLGCGNGRYAITSAIWRPDFNHLAADILPLVLRYASRRGNQRGLKNLRFACIDGLALLRDYCADGSVREIHVYHPQPYHDPREAAKRLISPEFLTHAHRVLESDGLLYLQTDNLPYWDYVNAVVPAFFEWNIQERPWPDSPKGRTRREIIALKRRLPVRRGWGQRRNDIIPGELPLPTFDAGPKSPIDSIE